MTNFRPLVVVALLSLLGGCAHHFALSAASPMEPITEFSSTSSVDLQNGQPSKEQVVVLRNGLHTGYANFNQWTDAAIEIAARELSKRGMKIGSGAPKTITMSVEAANTDVGLVEIASHIDMRVKTSDGYSAVYVGENRAFVATIPGHHLNGTLMRTVHEMLMDPHIVAFLTK